MRSSLTALAVFSAGTAAGVGAFTFGYARGYSYLLNDPAACANCHVMREQWEGWQKSSHRNVATCNDCHTPPGLVGKYATKALNGFNHSLAFTTGRFHEPIRANAMNQRIAREACAKCHASVVESLHALGRDERDVSECARCHGAVGHRF
jgi:cytochrome c nitrite reductase small subunit